MRDVAVNVKVKVYVLVGVGLPVYVCVGNHDRVLVSSSEADTLEVRSAVKDPVVAVSVGQHFVTDGPFVTVFDGIREAVISSVAVGNVTVPVSVNELVIVALCVNSSENDIDPRVRLTVTPKVLDCVSEIDTSAVPRDELTVVVAVRVAEASSLAVGVSDMVSVGGGVLENVDEVLSVSEALWVVVTGMTGVSVGTSVIVESGDALRVRVGGVLRELDDDFEAICVRESVALALRLTVSVCAVEYVSERTELCD